MGDTGEDFRVMREFARDKKAKNKKDSTQILIDNNIEFESKNYGVHLIIRHNGFIVDFWPSTGLFEARAGWHGRGVKNLLKKIK